MADQLPATPAIQIATPGHYNIDPTAPHIEYLDDLNIDNASMDGLLEFVRVRKGDILLGAPSGGLNGNHFKVEAEVRRITLAMREHGAEQQAYGMRAPATTIVGQAKFSVWHSEVKKLMGQQWTAADLSKALRAKRHLFADDAAWRTAWTALRNTEYKVEAITKAHSTDLGKREESFAAEVVNASPVQWEMTHAIFQGDEPKARTFEVMFEVKNGGVQLSVFNDFLYMEETLVSQKKMDDVLAELREIVGEAIPFVHLNC